MGILYFSKMLDFFQTAKKKFSFISFSFIYKQLLFSILIACGVLSIIIPPFQSPDEHDHIKRAYLLGKGVLVLDRAEGQSSGGYIDDGLYKFMQSYGSVKDKLSEEEISSANEIEWSGVKVYNEFPGTGYYFPAIYLPQAIGLGIGELLEFNVDHSYRLARAFALFAIIFLFYAAFRLYPPNPLVLALISIPMTLFQFSSASLDGVSTALAVFSISSFLKIANDRDSASVFLQYACAFAIALLASSRIHAFPLLLLLAATFIYTKNKRSFFLFAAVGFFVFSWTIFSIKTTVDLRVPINESTSNIIIFYLLNPSKFFSVFWQTLSNEGLQEFYCKSFFGILGWLDSPFQSWHYTYFASFFSIIALLTLRFGNIRNEWSQRLLLLAISVISVFFIFFALLVTWSPHPAQIISGIQGRYFLIPMIILAYSVSGNIELGGSFRKNFAAVIVFFLFVFSVLTTINLLVTRYYLVENKIATEAIGFPRDGSKLPVKMISSAPLKFGVPVVLKFPVFEKNILGNINRIGIFFGTHIRKNPGEAELILTTKEGFVHRQSFTLPDLIDNNYNYFRVPPESYSNGEIRFLSGGGISVLNIHSENNEFLSCLKLNTIRNQNVFINGCP